MSFEASAWAIKQKTKLPTEKLVLIALSDCHNRDTGRCDPSLLTLAEIALCSDRTAMRSIESLTEQGLILCEKSPGKRTKYKLIFTSTPDTNVTTDKLSPVSPVTVTPDTHVTTPLTPMSPEPVSIRKEPVIKRVVNKFSDEDLHFAEWFYEKILLVAPKTKKPNIESWAEVVRKMRALDKLTHREMALTFKWANSDQFWSTNVLSPEKLRKQYARLHAESRKSKEPREAKTTGWRANISPEEAEFIAEQERIDKERIYGK